MAAEALLRRVEEHFRRREWDALESASRRLLASARSPRVKRLAEGFCKYARARRESDPGRAAALLGEAEEAFRGVDEFLHAASRTERLLLLSVLDEDNRGRHLKELGEFSLNRFLRTGSEGDIRLAIEALERAREALSGRELAEVEVNLTFCYGSLAEVSDSPGGVYKRLLALCRELESKHSENPPVLARLRMNHALALQRLAELMPEEAERLLTEAAEHCRSAAEVFRELGSRAQQVRALQNLAEVYRQAARTGIEHLEKFVEVKEETAAVFRRDGYEGRAALEELEAALAEVELASARRDERRLEQAIRRMERLSETFQRLGMDEELAHSLAAAGAAHRSFADLRGGDAELLRRAAECYERAAELFERGGRRHQLGAAKEALAGVYREMALKTGEKEYELRAEELKREAEKILRKEE
ncbi:MAG: hypothetical protein GXO66_02620 [Euryarchaeota archaeon]|nr:hypothetical protein [Euryarchaeota archaeon]